MTTLWSTSSTSICFRCRLMCLAQHHDAVSSRRAASGVLTRNIASLAHEINIRKHAPRGAAQKRLALILSDTAGRPRRMSMLNPISKSSTPEIPPEEAARSARQIFGERLPEGCLSPQAYNVYERLYGPPLQEPDQHLWQSMTPEHGSDKTGNTLYREGGDGKLEEVQAIYRPAGMVGANEAESWLQEDTVAEKDDDFSELEEERFDPDADGHNSETDPDYMRAHPLTMAGRFATAPTTIQLPKTTFTDPISDNIADRSKKHLSEAAQRTFGGPGLPYSVTAPKLRGVLEQKALSLQAGQSQMTEMEADVYITSVMPGMYASIMSTIVEVRKRLGSEWLERLLGREGGPQILDAGAGGAAVTAWREVLRSEWQRMHEGIAVDRPVPFGKATVLTGSSSLRHRSSRFLDNTTFLPRLPDYVHATDQNSGQQRKQYDIIIAPHSLLHLREEYLRKQQVQNLWSLLRPEGGVLILIEKGLPRGFEAIAGARKMLLDNHLSSPNKPDEMQPMEQSSNAPRETGMIIAPCTNHEQCPMYTISGTSQGRKDFCHFSQRYIRPPYLQRILNAKDRNHEDVRFSYVAIQRGRDQRQSGLSQGRKATDAAFAGFEARVDAASTPDSSTSAVNTLSLPRAVWPPIKRKGHVILDLCTPAGKLERWTVPRSFSKQAFRDARKSEWGDLWALGAKTRTKRNVRLGEKETEGKREGKGNKRRNNAALV